MRAYFLHDAAELIGVNAIPQGQPSVVKRKGHT